MSNFIAKVGAVGLMITLPFAASAQGICLEPRLPECIFGLMTFQDETSFGWCNLDFQDYHDDVVRYSECLGKQVEVAARDAREKHQAAVAKYEQAVEYWNCRTESPDAYCPAP